MKHTRLSVSIALACCMSAGLAMAQNAPEQTPSAANSAQAAQRTSASSTSNQTTSNDTKRVQQLSAVLVQGKALSLGGGLMSVQTAPKAVSTISRDAIVKAAPGGTFVQMIDSIPGVNASTDDFTGLANGNYSIRGFTSDEIGTTVNGAPINDSGNYKVYSTEYGDTENYGDITVLQGYPDVDTPVSGAAGGSIAWVTIDPSHTAGLDVSQTLGSNDYRRTFLRLNTGDTGAFRSWVSYSHNEADLWRGPGHYSADKIDAKSIWTINNDDSISASFQYNREMGNEYYSLSKAQAQQNYNQGYDATLLTPTDTNFYKLHLNPFRSYMVSMDGEFRLSDSLHLSVVPYFQYGYGGGGSGTTFTETTSTLNLYRETNQDLNGDGVLKGSDLVYAFSASHTYRPGIIAKLNQDFGENNSLEYGFWYDKPRQSQSQVFSSTAPVTGIPSDQWAAADLIRYPDGSVQKAYDEFTRTDTRKVFATDTWTPTDQLTLTAGVSYLWVQRDGFDYEWPGSVRKYQSQIGGPTKASYHDWSPTAGATFQLNDQNQFYIGAGKTFRAPVNSAILLNAIVATAPDGYGTPINGLVNKPETATTYDAGWRYYGGQFSANVDAYASILNNKQVSGYDENTGQSVYLSIPRLHMSGLTAEASYKITPDWTAYASYAYTKSIMQSSLNTDTISPGPGVYPSDLGDGIYNTKGKTFINTPLNSGFVRLGYDHGPLWASIDAKYRGAIWGDWSNTEKVGGYTTINLSAGWRFSDFSSWFRKPYIKLNAFNLADHKALTYASNISAYLASNPNGIKDVNGTKLYASAPYYSLLEGRTVMVTLGASLF
ncbi:hypothetical protein B0E47_10835 [Rhodanobacter sp. B05]|uniref:TonB-dependent receptor n=1 Tax=Rhodanobacter sp. B05 TaxID=1945859 RepID=UPI0009854DEA|nr:TonB-dependent receptor [Rhodanobacter sp. B05]OOG54569.1 hypothetical protein B0E47_10835 [Rhodanobacter sp. B05]